MHALVPSQDIGIQLKKTVRNCVREDEITERVTSRFIDVFSFKLNTTFSMQYPEIVSSYHCAHRARDGSIMCRATLDVEVDTVWRL